VKHKKTEEENK